MGKKASPSNSPDHGTSRRITLYSGPLSMFGIKVHIAALEKNLDVQLVLVPFDIRRGYDPKHPEVLRINPKRQVPVLIDSSVEIFDSTQISEYLEDLRGDPALWPTEVAARAKARQWEHWSDEVYFPNVVRLMENRANSEHPVAVEAFTKIRQHHLDLVVVLRDKEYIASTYSYADIAIFMANVFAARMKADLSTDMPSVSRWRETIARRPAVRQAMRPLLDFIASNELYLPSFLSSMKAVNSGAAVDDENFHYIDSQE